MFSSAVRHFEEIAFLQRLGVGINSIMCVYGFQRGEMIGDGRNFRWPKFLQSTINLRDFLRILSQRA
jgi:hypothetical protein